MGATYASWTYFGTASCNLRRTKELARSLYRTYRKIPCEADSRQLTVVIAGRKARRGSVTDPKPSLGLPLSEICLR